MDYGDSFMPLAVGIKKGYNPFTEEATPLKVKATAFMLKSQCSKALSSSTRDVCLSKAREENLPAVLRA